MIPIIDRLELKGCVNNLAEIKYAQAERKRSTAFFCRAGKKITPSNHSSIENRTAGSGSTSREIASESVSRR